MGKALFRRGGTGPLRPAVPGGRRCYPVGQPLAGTQPRPPRPPQYPQFGSLWGSPAPKKCAGGACPLVPASCSIPILFPQASGGFRTMLEDICRVALRDGGDQPRGTESGPAASPSQLPTSCRTAGTAHPGTSRCPGSTSGVTLPRPAGCRPQLCSCLGHSRRQRSPPPPQPQGVNKLPEGWMGPAQSPG